jgi:hypothetical protein
MFFGLNDVAFLAAVSAPAGPTDPNFANVSLLLHGDGANGSTTIIDSSPSPKTVTAFGDAQISTAQSKFGGASILFDGSGDYLSTPHTSAYDISSGDFTIECWIRPSVVNTTQTLISTRAGANDGFILRQTNNSLFFAFLGANVTNTTSPATLLANTWHHVAATRFGSNFRVFVDGQAGTVTTTSFNGFPSTSTTLHIGVEIVSSLNNPVNGYIDDLRITKGVARYTANFTPPTAPFPDA